MKKVLILTVSAFILNSCGTPSLYYWGGEKHGTTNYENLAYKDYKSQTPDALCKLIYLYEDMVSNPGGTRSVPPPGICAEYGYLLLLPETADTFSENATYKQRNLFSGTDYGEIFYERGKEMLEKEIEYYPESKQFIEPLIKKLTEQ